jgi:hypothetical protein
VITALDRYAYCHMGEEELEENMYIGLKLSLNCRHKAYIYR